MANDRRRRSPNDRFRAPECILTWARMRRVAQPKPLNCNERPRFRSMLDCATVLDGWEESSGKFRHSGFPPSSTGISVSRQFDRLSLAKNFLTHQNFQLSIAGLLCRNFLRATRSFLPYPFEFLLEMQAVRRPAYAYCMWHAAVLAKRLGIDRISAIEFGVASGKGLESMSQHAKRIESALGIETEIYGFDTAKGLPQPVDERDLPHWFLPNLYAMNIDKLKYNIPNANLVIGNIEETAKGFLEKYGPPPIGAIMVDLDFYSSTRDALDILLTHEDLRKNFLPRLCLHFDDVVGDPLQMYGEFNGELLAIKEFNERSKERKIHLNRNLLPHPHVLYRYHIYYAHLFDHPLYRSFVAGPETLRSEKEHLLI